MKKTNETGLKTKWFYPGQDAFRSWLNSNSEHAQCVYQITSQKGGRIVEHWQIWNGEKVRDILVTIIKHGMNNSSLIIYNMEAEISARIEISKK